MMRALRSALALLLAAGLAGCAYGGGGGGYGYQQADAYPGYGYSAGPSIGLGFGSNNYGGYPAYIYYPNYPHWQRRGTGTVRRPAAIPATDIIRRRLERPWKPAAQCRRGSSRQAADLQRQADLRGKPVKAGRGRRRQPSAPAAARPPLPSCQDCDN